MFSAKAIGGLFPLPLLCSKLPFSTAFPNLDAKERACLVSIYFNQGQNKLKSEAHVYFHKGRTSFVFVSCSSLAVTKSGFKHFPFANPQSLHEAWLSITIKSMFTITRNQLNLCEQTIHEMACLPLHLQLLLMFTFKERFCKNIAFASC